MRTSLSSCKLIAIAGLKNSGKDTVSGMLEYLLNAPKPFKTFFFYNIFRKWPGKWNTTAFAKPLKDSLSVILHVPIDRFDDRHFKENVFVDLDSMLIIDKSLLDDDDILSENKFSKLIKTETPITGYLSIRQLMQYYGTSVIRKFLGDKTWINSTLNQCVSKNTIVSDLRFKVEYNEVKLRDGIIIYIERPGCTPGSHSSEREVLEMKEQGLFDHTIKNDGSLKDLFYKIKDVIYGRS